MEAGRRRVSRVEGEDVMPAIDMRRGIVDEEGRSHGGEGAPAEREGRLGWWPDGEVTWEAPTEKVVTRIPAEKVDSKFGWRRQKFEQRRWRFQRRR